MKNINPNEKCLVCGTTKDELGLCDPYCPVMIAEDDQERAAAYEAMDAATEPEDPELVERTREIAREVLAYLRFKRDLRP